MGQKAGEKWTAEAVSQPTIPKSDRLLATRKLSLPVRGFLISVTGPDQMALPPGQGSDPAALRAVNVLLQSQPDYIEHILTTLHQALGQASASP